MLAAAACALLAACAHSASAPPPAAAPSGGAIGYVRMDALVRAHPLYPQLARYDDNIAALNLDALVPAAIAAGPDLAREEARLQAQLQAAAKRTNDIINAKGVEYQRRENAAIAVALQQAARAPGPSVGSVQHQMESTAQTQLSAAQAQAQRDLEAYGKQLQREDMAQIEAAQAALAARADRTYRAKADEYTASESALALKLASDDAAQRLELRTKLTGVLSDADRDEANKELAALDRKEADALAAQRNGDQLALAALQQELQVQVAADLKAQVAPIHARSQARFEARYLELRKQFASQNGPLIATTVNGRQVMTVNPNLPPDVRRRIEALHAQYTAAFQKDAQATVADFNKTRADLSARYMQLRSGDTGAALGAQTEMAALQKKRSDLYAEMVAQIGREVKTIAQQRGISVVVSDVAAPAGGIDLTDDAMKDIQTLHE